MHSCPKKCGGPGTQEALPVRQRALSSVCSPKKQKAKPKSPGWGSHSSVPITISVPRALLLPSSNLASLEQTRLLSARRPPSLSAPSLDQPHSIPPTPAPWPMCCSPPLMQRLAPSLAAMASMRRLPPQPSAPLQPLATAQTAAAAAQQLLLLLQQQPSPPPPLEA